MPAKLILLQGESSTGKSTSLETMPPEETYIISPNGKDLPFKGGAKKYNKEQGNKLTTTQLTAIPKVLKTLSDDEKYGHVKYVIIEDFTHFFNARLIDKAFIAKKAGGEAFAKWQELGADISRVISGVIEEMRDDMYVIIIAHTELNEVGEWVLQTPGKMLDKSINVVSYFTYVFHTDLTENADGSMDYTFLTNRASNKQAKTPRGMFAKTRVPNDLFAVLNEIKNYQEEK